MCGHGNEQEKWEVFYYGTYNKRNKSNPEICMPTWKSKADILIATFKVMFLDNKQNQKKRLVQLVLGHKSKLVTNPHHAWNSSPNHKNS